MTEMNLEATVRHGTGRRVTGKLRRQGLVPGVIYGVGDPVAIQFDARIAGRLVHVLHGGERLISLKVADPDSGKASEHRVLLKEVQTTPVGTALLHIDFHEVDVLRIVQVGVEVRALGRAKGEVMGGVLQQVSHQVLVECLPTAIPEYLDVDVSALDIGHTVHVSDLVLPENVRAVTSGEETLFVLAAPRVGGDEAEEGLEAEIVGDEAAAPAAKTDGEE